MRRFTSSVRRYSTRPQPWVPSSREIREDAEQTRLLRKQERQDGERLLASIDDYLYHVSRHRQSATSFVASVDSKLNQNRYVCTERLAVSEDIVRICDDNHKHFAELKEHVKDVAEEPYPEWKPGDLDVLIRRALDPKTTAKDVELELSTRRKDASAALDHFDQFAKNLDAVEKLLKDKGISAAKGLAEELSGRSKTESKKSASLDPVDLDTISDIPP